MESGDDSPPPAKRSPEPASPEQSNKDSPASAPAPAATPPQPAATTTAGTATATATATATTTAAAEQEEAPAEEIAEPPAEMTLDMSSFRKPGEKTFTQRARLFVGNLPLDIPEEEFISMFAKYGDTREVFINRERGFGFIRLETHTLAEIAKAELDGTVLNNRPVRIRFATHGAALTVRNLLPTVTNELLEQAFSQFGPVERAVVVTDDRGRPTGRGVVEFANKAAARKALERCGEGALLLTTTPCPAIVEPSDHFDEEDGLPEKLLQKTPKYLKEREQAPRFAQPGTFEFEYSSRWKALDEMEKQQREQVERNIREAKEKLEAELESAKHEHQLMLMRQDLMRRQEELRRLEELRNQELQRRKQFEMRHEEERRRREEELLRHREQEDLRRQPDAFKPNYIDSREQEMRVGDPGPRGPPIGVGDGFNVPGAGGGANASPAQMMAMSARAGPGALGAPEGGGAMVAPMMAENGAMRGDRYPQGPAMGGRPEVESPNQQQQQQQSQQQQQIQQQQQMQQMQQQQMQQQQMQQQQQQQQAAPLGPQVGAPPGFGRGSPVGGVFEGPNSKRRRF